MNSSGQEDWAWTSPDVAVLDKAVQSAAGDICLGGESFIYDHGESQDEWPMSDIMLVRLSSSGEEQWRRTIERDGKDWLVGMRMNSDDTVTVITTNAESTSTGWERIPHGPETAYLIQIARDGTTRSERQIAKPSSLQVADAKPTKDGGWILAGRRVENGEEICDALTKLSASGDVEWNRGYLGDYLKKPWNSMQVEQTSDGGYGLMTTVQHQHIVYFIKLDAGGNDLWDGIILDEEPSYAFAEMPGTGYLVGSNHGVTRFDAEGRWRGFTRLSWITWLTLVAPDAHGGAVAGFEDDEGQWLACSPVLSHYLLVRLDSNGRPVPFQKSAPAETGPGNGGE